MARSSIKRQSTGSTYSSSNKRPRHISQSPSTDSDNEVSRISNDEKKKASRKVSPPSPSSKKKNRSTRGDEDEDEDVKGSDSEKSDDNEEQYEVTKIKSHKKVNGVYMYKVGWKGYDSCDDTTEPESNLTGAKELLEAYKIKAGLKKISKDLSESKNRRESSGIDKSNSSSRIVTLNGHGKPTNADRQSVKNRRQDDDKENKVDKDQSETESEEDDEEWHRRHIKLKSWEHLVKSVRTIDREDGDSGEVDKNESDGGLRVNVLWKENGRNTWVPNRTAREKIPQKLLDFYEAHVQFSSATE